MRSGASRWVWNRLSVVVAAVAAVAIVAVVPASAAPVSGTAVLPIVTEVTPFEYSGYTLDDVHVDWGTYGAVPRWWIQSFPSAFSNGTPPPSDAVNYIVPQSPTSYRAVGCPAGCAEPPDALAPSGVAGEYAIGPWWNPATPVSRADPGPVLTAQAIGGSPGTVTGTIDVGTHTDASSIEILRNSLPILSLAPTATTFADSGPFPARDKLSYTAVACYRDCSPYAIQVGFAGVSPPGRAVVVPNPKIRVAPNRIGQGGSQTVELRGAGFEPGSTVTFSDAEMSVVSTAFVNPTLMRVKVSVPATAAAPAFSDVTVSNTASGNQVCASCYLVWFGPTLSGATPAAVSPGTSQVIFFSGDHLQPAARLTAASAGVSVDEVVVTSETAMHAKITVAANAHPGPVRLVITNVDAGRSVCASCISVT